MAKGKELISNFYSNCIQFFRINTLTKKIEKNAVDGEFEVLI